jgi:hypothetical protein
MKMPISVWVSIDLRKNIFKLSSLKNDNQTSHIVNKTIAPLA